MKIGRNDPCPCGSGKKYKKCCISQSKRKVTNVNTVPIEDSNSDFNYIKKTSKKLELIITRYNIDDVTKAIYCINSWANNRSALAQALTLNHALSNTKKFGNQNIKTYSEFKAFFEAVADYLPITSREDLTLNDFGQVKIIVHGETFPIILGTGHEHVYAAMYFLPVLARIIGMTDDLKTLLHYNHIIINELAGSNISSPDKNNYITFELPSEQSWQAVNNLFKLEDFLEHAQKAFKIMGYQKCPIEMRHFFVYMGNYYPLFNTSILVDFYKRLLSLATEEEYYRHINLTIGELIENTFNFSENTRSRVLIAPRVFDRNTRKPYTDNHLAFMTVSGGRVLIAINKGDFDSDDSIDCEIHTINLLHERNQLRLCETYYREELPGGYAFDVHAEMSIQFLLIEPFTDISAHGAFLRKAGEYFLCSALDLIYILGFMEDFDELLDFIEYDRTKNAKIISFGGKSDLFFAWKDTHRHIASGAIEYSLISVSPGTADEYVFEYYVKDLANYPFGLKSELFANPLGWKVEASNLGYSRFIHKGCQGFGGEGKMVGYSTFLFLAHNVEFFKEEDFTQEKHNGLRVVDELNQRLFNRYGETLGTFPFLHGKVLQVLFMPMDYARSVDNSGFTLDKNKKYVYSDIYVDKDTVIIRYSVNLMELQSDIMKAKDKSIESAYFLELLEPLRKHMKAHFAELDSVVKKDSSLKKEVDVFTVEQDYYYSDMTPSIQIEPRNFAKARKEIAKVCLAAGIEPGEYRGKAATDIIRRMQTAIVGVFENQISQYNKENLHKKALNYYVTQLHGTIINLKRYSSFRDLELSVQREFEENTRKIREEYRRNLRTAQYLLESNLALQHRNGFSDCKKKEFRDLLAFADWLVVLQDNSDICYHTDFDLSIEIDDQYRVDVVSSEFSERQYEQITLRKYKQQDYTIKNDEGDREYMLKCANAFLEDTGIELGTLISLLEYLQLEVVGKPFVREIYPNVFEAKKEDLINDFLKLLTESKEGDRNKTINALNFITLDCDKLKFLNGKVHDILPFWEREKRDNRFDVKPIIIQKDKCIFSPVVMKQLATLWKSGFLEWYLPFEIGLEKVKTALAKWKKRYEDEMVQDIADLFTNAGFHPVITEVNLASRYPGSHFPEELGDYDVIAVNKSKREIWLIESKVLQKVGSIYEDQMQQKDFFFNDKWDEKFQRRIDYVIKNLSKVATALKLDAEDYIVVPYMVTNKLFTSRYKKLDFPIISYDELKQKLRFT